MKNVDMKVDGKKLVITVDLDQEFGNSKSGKTIIISSTEGFAAIPGVDNGATLSMNVFKKKG